MALTKEFVEAVTNKNLLRIKIMLKDSLLVDTSFNQFNEMLNYAEPRVDGLWISNDEDDEELSDMSNDLNSILAGLVNNFSKRRVSHLMGMINKMYPPQCKTRISLTNVPVPIKRTREVNQEYSAIITNLQQIKDVTTKIKTTQMCVQDIDEIKRLAMGVVNHCNMITRK